MFEVGDIVVLKNIDLNDNILLNKCKKYTIKYISLNKDGKIRDLYLKEFPHTPFYHIRFDLDLAYVRKQKIKKLEKICLSQEIK